MNDKLSLNPTYTEVVDLVGSCCLENGELLLELTDELHDLPNQLVNERISLGRDGLSRLWSSSKISDRQRSR